MILAFALFTGGWTISRGPRRVTIDDDGLQIEQSRGGPGSIRGVKSAGQW